MKISKIENKWNGCFHYNEKSVWLLFLFIDPIVCPWQSA